MLFQRLQDHKILINQEKCKFAKESIQFLGHEVDQKGIRIADSRIEAIQNFPKPTSTKELERFLGLFAFLHRFIPNVSGIVSSLHDLRKIKTSKKFQQSWTDLHDEAFQKAKWAIAKTTKLTHPNPEAEKEIWSDASEFCIGAL